MPEIQRQTIIVLEAGLHTRPAALFLKAVKRFFYLTPHVAGSAASTWRNSVRVMAQEAPGILEKS